VYSKKNGRFWCLSTFWGSIHNEDVLPIGELMFERFWAMCCAFKYNFKRFVGKTGTHSGWIEWWTTP